VDVSCEGKGGRFVPLWDAVGFCGGANAAVNKVDEGVLAAWDEEVKMRVAGLDSGKAKTIPWEEVRQRNLAKLSRAR
jgi:hypothetical protein